MLSEALAFPRRRDDAVRDLLLGGALVLSSALLVPGVLVWGYLLRVVDAGARGRAAPPPLDDWERMLLDGLRATAVVLVWGALPLAAVVAVGFATAAVVLPLNVAVMWLNVSAVTPTGAAVFGGVVLVSLALAAVVWLHLPAALAAVATQGSLRAGFRPGALWSVVATREYVVGVGLAALVWAGGALAGSLLAPLLVGFVLWFYVQVAAAYVVGRAVAAAAATASRDA